MKINSHQLKIMGKVELPHDIETGHNYHVATEGSVNKVELHDNEDGTWDKIYTFKPIHVSLLTPKGESLKLKDPRNNSQKIRNRLFGIYSSPEEQCTHDFDRVYDVASHVILEIMPSVYKEAIKRLNA